MPVLDSPVPLQAPDRRARLGTGLLAGALAGLLALDLGLPSLVSWLGDRSTIVLWSAAAAAFLWLTPLRRLAGAGVALLALVWLVVSYTPVTSRMAEGLVRSDPAEPADAVFVFSSRIQEDGDPTADAMSRLLKGVQLVAEGRAPRLLVSELPPPSGPYAPLARAWLASQGRGGEVIVVGRIGNTRDEAVLVGNMFRERGWSKVLAVTSPLHTRRAALALEKEGVSVAAVPAIETRFDLERLDWPGDRRRAFSAVGHERVGIFVYRRRGWVR
jgi:uncharacterized SAM-binding protein YcdF (DUF218 family)